MQAYMFPRTSGARNPMLIVRILIFLRIKVVLQAKSQGRAILRVGPDSCKYLRHKKKAHICLQGAL